MVKEGCWFVFRYWRLSPWKNAIVINFAIYNKKQLFNIISAFSLVFNYPSLIIVYVLRMNLFSNTPLIIISTLWNKRYGINRLLLRALAKKDFRTSTEIHQTCNNYNSLQYPELSVSSNCASISSSTNMQVEIFWVSWVWYR